MVELVDVKSKGKYKIQLKYADGIQGIVDLSDFSGRGVFKQWDDADIFDAVQIDESGAVSWNEILELCPDMLYMRLTGKSPEEVFPNLEGVSHSART